MRVLSVVLRSACLGHHRCRLEDVCPAMFSESNHVFCCVVLQPIETDDADTLEECSLVLARLYRFISGVEVCGVFVVSKIDTEEKKKNQAGYWKRNGETAVVYQWYYCSVSCFEYRKNDLWLLRAMFQIMATNRSRFESMMR